MSNIKDGGSDPKIHSDQTLNENSFCSNGCNKLSLLYLEDNNLNSVQDNVKEVHGNDIVIENHSAPSKISISEDKTTKNIMVQPYNND